MSQDTKDWITLIAIIAGILLLGVDIGIRLVQMLAS